MKRFLSVILALALVLSIAPMTFATEGETETPNELEYVFSWQAVGQPNTGLSGKRASYSTDIATYDIVKNVGLSDEWEYVGTTNTYSLCFSDNSSYFATETRFAGETSNTVVYRVKVDEPGVYKPVVSYLDHPNGGEINAYIVSASDVGTWNMTTGLEALRDYVANGDESVVKKIGGPRPTYDANGLGTTGYDANRVKTIDGENRYFAAGEWYFILNVSGAAEDVPASTGSKKCYYYKVRSLKLSEQVPTQIEVSCEDTYVECDEKTSVSSVVYDAEGNALPAKVNYTSSDSTIATVDENGVVTGVGNGVVTITAKVEGYDDLSKTVEITAHKTAVIRYVFKASALGYSANIGFTNAATHAGEYSTLEGAYADSNKWMFGAMRSAYSGGIYTNANALYFSSSSSPVDDMVSLRINVPGNATKTYAPVIEYDDALSYGGTVDIYIFKGQESGNLSNKYCVSNEANGRNTALATVCKELKNNGAAYKIATITTYPGAADSYNNIELAPGDYWLAIVPTGGSRAPSSNKYHYKIQSLTLTETTEPRKNSEYFDAFNATEEKYSDAPLSSAKVSTFVAYLGETKDSASADITSATVTLGEKFTVSAEEKEGYKFLYWAKGMSTERKQIVSYSADYSFVPTVENTYLIAVYEPETPAEESAKAEFYNGNGQLIATLTENGNAPALPEMAGYGKATGWKLYGTEEVIEGGAAVEVSGTKLYVAQYNALSETYSVTVTNGTGSGNYKYGQLVTCTPSGEGTFIGWEKDGKLISASSTYQFRVWENCDVCAVYADVAPVFSGKKMKIAIDTFTVGSKTAVMAEFIGIMDAVEKGIAFGTKHIAMTSDANQFTVINDEGATQIYGYAIFKDGTIVYDR